MMTDDELVDKALISTRQEACQPLLEAGSGLDIANVLPLTEVERHQLLVAQNAAQVVFPEDTCIHQLFEVQVERTPDAVAVICEDAHLTYHELNQRANRLAHRLHAQGVGPEMLVGIYIERSLEMIVGILGVLKAGGAYVPLDPVYPKERLAFILQDTQAVVLLTNRRLAEGLPEHNAQVICLDVKWETIDKRSILNPTSEARPENLAYIIYTSGSTGRPKGVQITHRAVSNLISWHQQAFTLSPRDRTTHLAGLGFDATVWELWPYLATGASISLLDDDTRVSPLQLRNWLITRAITISFLPTPLAESLIGLEWPMDVALRSMLVGGDRLRHFPPPSLPFELVNNYGPTENTVVTTSCLVSAEEQASLAPPIGYPITNTQVYVLDQQLQLAPIGASGELYIGGESLARGYLKQPDLTAERFIPNPFSGESGARLYKTGDLARYLPDGNLEFLGRTDHQIKLRGYRIELGEIETVLIKHPAVHDAVVLVHEDQSGGKRLVAYVVADQQTSTVHELRSYLQEQLPEYMVPSAFVLLEALPLTPNGKVDRNALPMLGGAKLEMGDTYLAPRSAVEAVLAGIWVQVLGVERIGISDNFFVMGGHSLLATQVISWVQDVFQVELPLRSLFEAPTIAQLASIMLLDPGEQMRIEKTAQLLMQLAPLSEDDVEATLAGKPLSSEHGNVKHTFELSPQRLALLKILFQQEGLATLPTQKISRRARSDSLPLSFAQQRLWFLEQREPGNPFYNVTSALFLTGLLNVAALEQSFNEIIQRHEALRTTFAVENGYPTQIITPALTIPHPVLDLSGLPLPEREVEAQKLAARETERPFDLARGPLLRILLLRLNKEEHVLLLTMHHIISDGWSMGVLFRELTALYDTYKCGKPSPLPDLPIQYADFALWQRERLQGDTLEAQLTYWKQRLQEAPAILELPIGRARPAVQTFRGARHTFILSRVLFEALQSLSQREGVTLFMALLAAFQTLLFRYTGQDDIVVGTPLANRTRKEIEGLIGCFINTVVLRTDLSGNPSFSELLARVREVALGAYTHQDLPFEQVVEALQPERSLSHMPLFQVLFVLQNAPIDALELSGLNLHSLEAERRTARFDLTLSVEETGQELRGELEYNTDLFDATTIARMAGHLQTLLEGIVAHPNHRLSELPVLTAAERQQILREWNATRREYPGEPCLHQLFEVQAEWTPDAIAVVFEEEQLSYRELNCRANQLAHYLHTLGVGPEVRSGLCVERSLDMLIGLLGILKAGGAYVPIAPDCPPDRLSYMLQDTRLPIVLTQWEMRETFLRYQSRLVFLDAEWEIISKEADDPIQTNCQPDNLIYVLYTSGSTGLPKGVMNTHRGLTNRILWMQDTYQLAPHDRVLQKTPFTFDVSAWEFFWPLVAGACLIIARPQGHRDSGYLVQTVAQQNISTIHFVPPMLQVFLTVPGVKEEARNLKRVICSGETLPFDLQQQFFVQLQAELHNLYGPTEASIDVTFWQCERDQKEPVVPIGRPIANIQMYILDAHLRPVPIGVVGELYIGGVGLARGYQNRPEMTAERFVPDSFGEEPGGRLYQTGDLARYREDGSIEFIGRNDQQVKLRGYRIELGEIETVLTGYPAVQEVTVLVHEEAPGDKRLVAYVVVAQAQSLTSSELRRYFQEKLPEYMIPTTFVLLEALPLTANGKVDRRALTKLGGVQLELEIAYVAPRNSIEEMLTEIWAQVLTQEQIGVHDNFFDLGGHSLLTTQVLSRIRNVFQVELPLRTTFEAPTIAGQAELIQAYRAEHTMQPPPIERVSRDHDLPLSFAQQRLWFLEQWQPNSPLYNIPRAMRLSGFLDIMALEESLNEMIRRHETLRTIFAMVQGAPIQIIAPYLHLNVPLIDLQELSEVEREAHSRELVTQEALRPFDLTRDPLLRARLLRLDAEEHILLLTLHHIVCDGWSTGVLFRELVTVYSAFSAARPSPLPDLPIQYADFAIWQRKWLQGEILEAQLSYWKRQLANAPVVLSLLTDHPRPPTPSFRGETHIFALSETLSESLRALSRQENVTLFMTLLAAFAALLFRYTGQNDLVIGSPIANRTQTELEGLIGFFVNTLPLRCQFSENCSFRDLLERVRETTLAAYSHQDLPFEKIVQELHLERKLNRNPLFQVVFTFQNAPMSALELPDLTMSPVEVNITTAKFDIVLDMMDTDHGLEGMLEYNIDLFDATTITNMLRHFEIVLEEIVIHTEQRLVDIPLLKEDENDRFESSSSSHRKDEAEHFSF